MITFSESRCMAGWVAGVILAVTGFAQTAPRISPPAQRGVDRGRLPAAARAVLPDPVILDGSNQPAEKKSEYGMIGDFEVPGDENARTGKVGGSSGGDGQPSPDAKAGPPPGTPAGGPGQKESAAKPGGGGETVSQATQPGGGAQEPQASDKPGGGGVGDPNAQPLGIRVAELGGETAGGAPDPSAQQRPAPVSIGDKAMAIPQPTQGSAGVVGAQQPAGKNTQIYEKPTGTGGKAPTGVQGPNRVEKGRTIPSGL